MNDLSLFFAASLLLLGLGLFGLTSRNSLIGMLIAVELLFCGAGLAIASAAQLTQADPALGQLAVLMVMGLAAAEATLILAIVLVVMRRGGDALVDNVSHLKG